VQNLLTPHLLVPLAVAVSLLLPIPVCQPGTGLCVLLAVKVLLWLPIPVCQPGMGLCVLLAVPLLVLVPVCQLRTGLCMLLAIAVPLVLPGYGGHAVSDKQPIPGGGVHSNRNAIKYMSFT
jgi:hypothetical protein